MSWVPGADGSGFGVAHLPYGVVAVDGVPRPAVRIGDYALDLARLSAKLGAGERFVAPDLNPFLAAGPPVWTAVRRRLTELLTDPAARPEVEPGLYRLDRVEAMLPFRVGDYVDFYSSEHHASNVGQIFRPNQPPLLPNWRHLPVGYHGRAGTVVVSGTPVVRPSGQRLAKSVASAPAPPLAAAPDNAPPGAEVPVFGPSTRLDIEAEVGFVVGVASRPGTRVSVDRFAEYVFGVVLVNDWSARDLQAWENQPLGPFLSKSFATSVSAWVTPLAALASAWVPAPAQDPAVLGYLSESPRLGLDLALTVEWNGTLVSSPPFAAMYWTPAQQLAHLTAGGASLRTGDLYASGTVSGPARDQVGSFLELTWGGTEPVRLQPGAERTFLADGDTVAIGATAPAVDGGRLTIAAVTGTIAPAPGSA